MLVRAPFSRYTEKNMYLSKAMTTFFHLPKKIVSIIPSDNRFIAIIFLELWIPDSRSIFYRICWKTSFMRTPAFWVSKHNTSLNSYQEYTMKMESCIVKSKLRFLVHKSFSLKRLCDEGLLICESENLRWKS